MSAPTAAVASLSLEGKVALVTGGAKGIGRAIAEALLTAGAEVAICGRNAPETLPEVGGRRASFHPCDVRDPIQVEATVEAVASAAGRLDILVNNAGGSPQADAATASPRFSERIVALNLLGPLYAAQSAYRRMAAGDGGVIVNICSVAAVRPSPFTAAYGAAKAGLLSLTESLAQEWGPKVRVNAIIVGLIDTEAAESAYGSIEAREAIAASLPLKRMGRADDVAAACLYLASPLAAYVSGAKLEVHGGGERPLFLDLVAQHAKVG